MATFRIYAVTNTDGSIAALVNASNKAQALAHFAKRTYGCEVAEPTQLIAATKAGIDVQNAGAEPAEEIPL